MTVRILHGDCRMILPTLEAERYDAVVTDPPYHLVSGRKLEDYRMASPDPKQRASRGFMGKAWDGGDVAFRPETWATVLRVAKPGAHLVAFGGPRTFHRLMCAIEDGGWEIRDTLMWVFGSGFPKSKNLRGEYDGWGTALKPAWEPIVLARKPLVGTVLANVTQHGTGALNIDGCRIEAVDGVPKFTHRAEPAINTFGDGKNGSNRTGELDTSTGRWPANVLHDGHSDVLAAFPDAVGQIPDASSSSRKIQHVYGAMARGNGRDGEASADADKAGAVGFKMRPGARRGDGGSAARFFYCAKADRADRNHGCEGRPRGPLNWSSGSQAPGTFQADGTDRTSENNHPTVKPHDLMRWLCRLVTPPGGMILDPFTGSGSTGRAAIAEGFRFEGIELEEEYAAIARERILGTQPGLAL